MTVPENAAPGEQVVELKNIPTLAELAARIHKRARKLDAFISDCEDLHRAWEQCKHGEWLRWLSTSAFEEWSVDSAKRGQKVGQLVLKFRNLRNLKLTRGTFSWLADYSKTADDDEMSAIEAELVKHAAKNKLSWAEAARFIMIGIGRYNHGDDYPDATLHALARLDRQYDGKEPWGELERLKDELSIDFCDANVFDEVEDALEEKQPDTDEQAIDVIRAAAIKFLNNANPNGNAEGGASEGGASESGAADGRTAEDQDHSERDGDQPGDQTGDQPGDQGGEVSSVVGVDAGVGAGDADDAGDPDGDVGDVNDDGDDAENHDSSSSTSSSSEKSTKPPRDVSKEMDDAISVILNALENVKSTKHYVIIAKLVSDLRDAVTDWLTDALQQEAMKSSIAVGKRKPGDGQSDKEQQTNAK